MKKLSLILILSLLITSCSQFATSDYAQRLPASATDEISYYLAVDKFKYYIQEYSVAMEGKIPEDIIHELRSVTIQDIIAKKYSSADLEDAQAYDDLIYDHLKEKGLVNGTKKEDLKWNYNFFRNKLNEAFVLTPSKYDISLSLESGEKATEREIPVEKALYAVDEMTLDSGHYISNRTTRAIFWEAIENNRTIEFHMGDSREFLKTLKAQGGNILYEVRPLAKNYNKIFIVQYPGEKEFRYAITNIGGHDRLNHLTNQLSLSNLSGGNLKTKVVIKGDLTKFHDARAEEHILQLQHLPKADRVIIGQKESIDGKFNIFWKMNAINQLYEEDPSQFSSIDKALLDKYMKVREASMENIFKDKKIVEDVFAAFEEYFAENPNKAPAKFKIFNYDNFTIEMCDYIFKSKTGKSVRWRVVSNVWGDEIVPIARAFKATGHTNVTYMGTAGAFANKGFKVGDLVIPNAVVASDKKLDVKNTPMKIEGAKYGGSVEHVGSPFEETTTWLKKAQARSEFVEVETSYLREIFNGPGDNVEMYLLISDILGSETETLANATSAKRKNAQNKLLAELFRRDAGSIPAPFNITTKTADETLKDIINEVLAKKGAAYRYHVFSEMKGTKNPTAQMVEAVAAKEAAYSDSILIDRLVKGGEVINDIKQKTGVDFEVGFNKDLINGKWSPKTDKLNLVILPKNAKDVAAVEKQIKAILEKNPELAKFMDVKASAVLEGADLVKSKLPQKIDPDILLKIYTYAGFTSSGLYKSVTYNGNVTFDFMPTSVFKSADGIFTPGVATAVSTTPSKVLPTSVGGTCEDMMANFLKVIY